MNIDNKQVGYRIRKIRENQNETMEEFGKKHFIPHASKGVVSNWENGYNKPNKKRLEIIAELGHASVEYLLYGDNAIDKIEVGNRINQIRLSKGDTLEEFGIRIARVLNVSSNKAPSKSNVSKWEAGSSLPNKARLKAIADIGDITVEELLYGEKTISNSELELIEKLTKENKQLKDEITELSKMIETIKSIVLSKGG